MTTPLRAVAYGGGVQSTALLVLAAQRTIDYPLFLFANTGDDSEDPRTLAYVREVAMPFAAEMGVELVELRRTWRDGRDHTLWQHVTKPGQKSTQLPVRGMNGAPQSRACTVDFKVNVIAKELRRRGATPEQPATVALGISVDEIERAKGSSPNPRERVAYPLLDLGLTRQDCVNVIAKSPVPIPVPPKSACFFCPFHSPQAWAELRRDRPELFAKSVELEQILIAKRLSNGWSPVYFSRFGRPLDEAITEAPATLFDDGPDGCDSGSCWT